MVDWWLASGDGRYWVVDWWLRTNNDSLKPRLSELATELIEFKKKNKVQKPVKPRPET